MVDFVGANLELIMLGLATALTVVVIPAFVAWGDLCWLQRLWQLWQPWRPWLYRSSRLGRLSALLKAAWDSDFGGIRTTLTDF